MAAVAPSLRQAAHLSSLPAVTMTGLPLPFIEISVKDGKLFIDAGGQTGEIKPTGEEDKFDANGKATVLFIRDEKKKIAKVKMDAMGFSFDGVKE